MSARVAIIINCKAGAGYTDAWANALAGKFRDGGMDPKVTLARSGEEVIEAARRAVLERVQVIVAGGGDGTLNAVASVLSGTAIHFGVLPLGTLNHFAKDLHIPLQLDAAIGNIIAGHCIRIDAAEVNGTLFLNNSSIGLYADLVNRREVEQRRSGIGKWPAFFQAMIGVLRRYPFLHVQMTLDGHEHQRRTPCVVIGNNAYTMAGLDIGERLRMDAGQLSVYIVRSQNRLALLGLAIRTLFGRLRQAKDFEAILTREIVIATRHARKRVATDGEVTMMDTPLRYRIRPGALNVIVPMPPAATGAD
jgi:diacylglycerol kinase family enzyme